MNDRSPDLPLSTPADWNGFRSFRKRPVQIDAVQLGLAEYADEPYGAWRVPIGREYPEWLAAALKAHDLEPVFASEDYWYFEVETLEGTMRGGPDDWLIRGVEGELYFCRDSIFRATYEPVS